MWLSSVPTVYTFPLLTSKQANKIPSPVCCCRMWQFVKEEYNSWNNFWTVMANWACTSIWVGVSLFFFATYLVSSACIFIMSELVFFVIPPTSFKLIVVKEASVSVSLVSNCHQEAQFFLHDSFRVRSKKMLVEIVIE